MAWCESMKMKRKGLDRGGDHPCCFPLSSPARKIRRLDADSNPVLAAEGQKNCPDSKEVSPPNFSFSASDFWASNTDCIKPAQDSEATTLQPRSMAIVPWVPRQLPFTLLTEGAQAGAVAAAAQMMEAEDDTEAATMEFESSSVEQLNECDYVRGTEKLAPWQHQHCMPPQLPQSASSLPITWYSQHG